MAVGSSIAWCLGLMAACHLLGADFAGPLWLIGSGLIGFFYAYARADRRAGKSRQRTRVRVAGASHRALSGSASARILISALVLSIALSALVAGLAPADPTSRALTAVVMWPLFYALTALWLALVSRRTALAGGAFVIVGALAAGFV